MEKAMEKSVPDITELPVWVGCTVKWVTGLTKRTTCDDIIYALLHNEGNPDEEKNTANYTIYERWGGVEKPLKGRTKILKLWRSWGSELETVEFYLRKNQDYVDSSEIFRSRRYRKAHHKLRQQRRNNRKTSESSASSDKDKQAETTVKAKTLEGLVKLVLSQEKTLREQCERIEHTDKCIDDYETKIHAHRVVENGHNYVQDAYLHEKGHNTSSSDEMDANDLEKYLNLLQHLVQVETKLAEENKKIDQLSNQILEFSQISDITSALDTTTVKYPRFSTPMGNNNQINTHQIKLRGLTETSQKYLDMSLVDTEAETEELSQTFRVEQLKLKYKMKREAPSPVVNDTVDVSQLYVTACEEPTEDIDNASMWVNANNSNALEQVQSALDESIFHHDSQCKQNAQLETDITTIDDQLKLKRLELSTLEDALVLSEEREREQPPKLKPKHNASKDTGFPYEDNQKPPRPPRIDMKKVGDSTENKLSVEEQCKLLILGDCVNMTHIGGSTSPGSSISDEGYGNSNSFDSSSNDEQSPLPREDTNPTKSILSKPKYKGDYIDHIDQDIHEVRDDSAMDVAFKPTANSTTCHENIKDDISQQFTIQGSPNSSKTLTITDTYIQQYIRAKSSSSGALHNSRKRRVTFGGVTYDTLGDDSDSNSDTGLSSLHSEDVSPAPMNTVLETLV
ncbi:unnamed protein product [Owenia fusiformis]|uniref:Ras-associating domain-containing protein n=1 Tax=Owenia fusiformis TaxID=6347 RepID=A0A8S4NXC8_OWEFU|nr:unnamed protein product [Owenia fusiformis]